MFSRSRAWVGTAVVAIASTAAIGVGVTGASAATVTFVRPGDFINVPGTISGPTGGGSAVAQFLKEGIRIKTDNQTDAIRGYYAIPHNGTPLADVDTVQYEWFGTFGGTQGEPGMPYNIDVDGDNKADVQLMGELAYGGKDVWLNRDAEDFTGITPTLPAGYFAAHAPCDGSTAQNGNQDGCGSAGSQYHGTLDDWVRSLALDGKTGKVISAGYIANGLIYNGVLRSQTIGPDQFVFTNEAAPTPDPDLAACNGVTATIMGSDNSETLVGTPGADVIAAGDGDDTVYGLGGNDIICGGDGNDKLRGNQGKDQLFGNDGNDRLYGAKGKDRCDGGAGVDKASKCEKKRDL